jgi:DNA (cytosine-5)-methyltransferase 1
LTLNYLSVCSGIEAATQAWKPLGWKPWAFSEIEPFPSAVLKHHYPDVPNLGDMTKFKEWPDADLDVLCGGTPCQSFSVAGLRQGLDDPRGNLMLTFGAIAGRYRPRWLVWENVPGVLSSNGGRDFGTFLGMLGQLGYGVAYRVLDAQHVRTRRFPWAVPQRRRRVFVVGYIGDWRRAAAVLFDRESLSGHPAPRRQAGKKPSPTLAARTKGGGGLGTDFDCDGGLVAARMVAFGEYSIDGTGSAIKARDYKDATDLVAHSLRGEGFDASEDGTGRGTPLVPVVSGALCRDSFAGGAGGRPEGAAAGHFLPVDFDCKGTEVQHSEGVTPPLRSMGHNHSHQNAGGHAAVAFVQNTRDEVRLMGGDGQIVGALAADTGAKQQCYIAAPWAVRRLTPTECERLMGFPDGFTQIPWRGKPAENCPDGPRYKALGNSWAVNCADWIGERIAEVDKW